MSLRSFSANHFPCLGRPKRLASALLSTLRAQSSYAQHGEDVVIMQYMDSPSSYDIGYIDIGANHPTKISNTFLLYKLGYKGFLVEPNPELASLCRLIRPKDHTIQIGITRNPSIKEFMISKTPVMSSFSDNHFISRNQSLLKTEYVPTMSLDQAFCEIPGMIGLISIDVEGMNNEVLLSSLCTLKRSHILCIEHDTPNEALKIRKSVEDIGFAMIKDMACNQIFLNKSVNSCKT
jgi:FkbM family methyltransferase